MMKVHEIVEFWSQLQRDDATGRWFHPADRAALQAQHSFNLDYPVSPYVGRIESANVIILGANAGYDPTITPSEFPSQSKIDSYVERVRDPENSDWSFVSTYYGKVNYGSLIVEGRAALINACPYRSPKISEEPENRKVLKSLPSLNFNRRWLVEAVLPLAKQGKRLIVAKRAGLWNLSDTVKHADGVVSDPAPVSPQITSTAWQAVRDFLRE